MYFLLNTRDFPCDTRGVIWNNHPRRRFFDVFFFGRYHRQERHWSGRDVPQGPGSFFLPEKSLGNVMHGWSTHPPDHVPWFPINNAGYETIVSNGRYVCGGVAWAARSDGWMFVGIFFLWKNRGWWLLQNVANGSCTVYPIGSMHGIFTYIDHEYQPNIPAMMSIAASWRPSSTSTF